MKEKDIYFVQYRCYEVQQENKVLRTQLNITKDCYLKNIWSKRKRIRTGSVRTTYHLNQTYLKTVFLSLRYPRHKQNLDVDKFKETLRTNKIRNKKWIVQYKEENKTEVCTIGSKTGGRKLECKKNKINTPKDRLNFVSSYNSAIITRQQSNKSKKRWICKLSIVLVNNVHCEM